MKIKLGNLDDPRKAQLARQADRTATELESQRELDSICLVVDMVRCEVSARRCRVGRKTLRSASGIR